MSTSRLRRRTIVAAGSALAVLTLSLPAATASPTDDQGVPFHPGAQTDDGFPCHAAPDGAVHWPVTLCHPVQQAMPS